MKVRNTSCAPVIPAMFAGIVHQDCQPPALAIANEPIGAESRLPIRTSTRPLAPSGAPLAALATNWRAGVAPKSIRYSAQSPLAIVPTY